MRGGLERLDEIPELPMARLNMAWQGLHVDDRRNSSLFFVANHALGPWWILGAQPPQGEVTGKRLFLLGMNDRFGRTLRYGRNGDGVVTVVEDGTGRRYRMEHKHFPLIANAGVQGWGEDSGTRLAAVYLTHDPHWPEPLTEPLVRYEYSARGELMAVYGRDGRLQRRFQYHPQWPGRMTGLVYAGRPEITYSYNEQGKVVELAKQGALSYRFEYAKDSTKTIDSLGRETVYHFEGEAGLRRVVKVQHPDGSITQSRFDPSGRQTSSIDALGRETQYELDVATGALLSITPPDGLQSRFSYNAQGQIDESTRPNGASDRYVYEAMGRLASVTDSLEHVTQYLYSDNVSEQPNAIIDARGGKKFFGWNGAGQLTSYTDCSGSITRYRYDHWGQLTGTLGEENTSTRNEYDARGWLIASTNALNQTTRYAYNEAGDLARITAPDGNVVQFERDVQGQPRAYHYGGYTQRFDYDDAGRMVRLTNENGAHTTFEYDVMDRLTKQVNFDGRTQHYQFNAVGDLLRSDDEGLVSRYHYDKGGRLLKRQMGESDQAPAEHFSYTQDGQLAKAWHVTELGGNTITAGFERDMLGRIIRETQSIVGPYGSDVWQHSVDFHFNELGIETKTFYTGLPAIEWQTYGPGHLHGMVLDGRSVIDFERDKLHRETQRRFGPTQTTRSYDALSRLSHLHTHSPLIAEEGSPSTLQRQHHYDAAGQLTRIETPRGPHEYGYDKAGRLIAASQPGLAMQHYRFDPAGNRLFENARITTGPEHWEETVRQHMGTSASTRWARTPPRTITARQRSGWTTASPTTASSTTNTTPGQPQAQAQGRRQRAAPLSLRQQPPAHPLRDGVRHRRARRELPLRPVRQARGQAGAARRCRGEPARARADDVLRLGRGQISPHGKGQPADSHDLRARQLCADDPRGGRKTAPNAFSCTETARSARYSLG
ncbi:RHS repeat protein [Diaphorobacter aerolatus]|uniref:RHS repeat protein n=1 Tax=Diaphorobacter aerolatus TaxID=1288495 RepID=A0A7H0GMG9_9BURK|nr:RHS repeat protein [Diaphorobacter aerolatus]QNP49485.1 RHS repeat protein [Diaphorobacter aerolatus]